MVCHSSVTAGSPPIAVPRPSRSRRLRRRRLRGLTLESAVRQAVDLFFRFTHRDLPAKSIWSESERVWLGRATFLDWALYDPEIDIPWIVAGAADAPRAADDLHAAVRSELIAYWMIQSGRLPCKSKPHWLPLP